MAGIAPRTETTPGATGELFRVHSDLTSRGVLGDGWLVASGGFLRRFETTPLGEETVGQWKIGDLRNPRIEDLVDATALIADCQDVTVELLRTTSKRSSVLAGAEKRIKALIEDKPLPVIPEENRVCPKCGRPLPEDSDICTACLNRGKTLIRLFEYTKPFRWRLTWGTSLTLFGTCFDLLPPLLTKYLVDDVLTQRHVSLFAWLIGALIGARVISTFVQIARGRNVAFLGREIAVSIRTSLFTKFQELSLAFYDKRNVGSIMSRMTNDTGALYDVLVDGIPVIVNQGALLIGIPIFMMLVNFRIALWALLPVPFVLYGVYKFRRRMMRVWSKFHHVWARMSGALNGVLQGTKVVKAFHGEHREVDRFGRRIQDVSRVGYEAESSWATFFPLVVLTMSISTFIVWGVGGNAVLHGGMTLGQLTAFLGYVAMLQTPLMMLQRIVDWSSRALTAAERVFEIIDNPIDVEEAPDAIAMPKVKGGVQFQDVHFAYDPTREVLHGIDLDVQPGEMIGIVGHSGAGKSTLINLLMRFYDPTAGAILLDGLDLRKIKLEDFRRQVGVVLQESYLFPGSIKDNVAYGRPECSLEEVIAAAKAANSHDFIVNFPDGYDTYVGERGQRLSGGERQRIAIARAILHNPKILILDEATASVDTETERMIQEALERLVEGRTVFAIAHRLSTLRNADRLVVIQEGKIAEIGTHDELLARDQGIYAKLVEMQQQINKMQQTYLHEGDPEEASGDAA